MNQPAFNPSKFALIGSDGAMGTFMRQRLDMRFMCIDKQHFHYHSARYTRKAARSAMREQKKQNVIWVSLPLDQFEEAAQKYGKRSRMAHLFGISGTGQRNTLMVHLSSIQSVAANVLEHHSGPVLGLHQLHRPGLLDLGEQSAIITVTPDKKKHHLYPASFEWMKSTLVGMGYGSILELDVELHDQYMSNVQFLRHSMFLIAAATIRQMLESGQPADQLLQNPSMQMIFWGIHRILNGTCHVYENIAKQNPYNATVLHNWKQAVGSVQVTSANNLVNQLFALSRTVVDEHFKSIGAGSDLCKKISTPVSRVSDVLMNICHSDPQRKYKGYMQFSMTSALNPYIDAIERNGYQKYFSELQSFWVPFFKYINFDPNAQEALLRH